MGGRGSGSGFKATLNNGRQPEKISWEINVIITDFKMWGVNNNEVAALSKELSDDEMIERLSGGDLTDGSCASLVLAYIGNKMGYDVLDFRGGESQKIIANKFNSMLKNLDNTEYTPSEGYVSSSMTAAELTESLKSMMKYHEATSYSTANSEYVFRAGAHTAIVRKVGEKVQYLELQSSTNSGWRDFNDNTLKDRFGVDYGDNYTIRNIKGVGGIVGFKQLLGYINTPENQQQKGSAGGAK